MKRVRAEREKLGWSQAELARRANVNASSMSRIELGYEPAFPKRGKRIADALGWKGDYRELFEDCNPDDTPIKTYSPYTWIPVTECLPETEDYVLVSYKTKKGVKVVNRSYYSGKYWSGVMSEVEAWMPLPAPYSGDDE